VADNSPSRDRVLAAAEEWVWVPPDAVDVVTDDYRVTRYPDWTSVQWSRTGRHLADVVDEVLDRARAAGHPVVRWWVKGTTEPPDTGATLESLGFELVETVDVLALDLAAGEVGARLAVPDDVSVVVADDEDRLRTAGEIRARTVGPPAPTPAQLAHALSLAREARRTGRWSEREWLVHVDDEPVGQAGGTLVGDVVRLWGGGVLPAARGRGAYRALLAARCREAQAAGAQLALVKGRVDTSAPILLRAGFTKYGQERRFQRAV